jgi:hypothetical protein
MSGRIENVLADCEGKVGGQSCHRLSQRQRTLGFSSVSTIDLQMASSCVRNYDELSSRNYMVRLDRQVMHTETGANRLTEEAGRKRRQTSAEYSKRTVELSVIPAREPTY